MRPPLPPRIDKKDFGCPDWKPDILTEWETAFPTSLHWWCTNGNISPHLVSIIWIQGRGLSLQIHPISPSHRFLLARHDLVNPRCLFFDILSPCDLVCQCSKCIECDNKIFNLICILRGRWGWIKRERWRGREEGGNVIDELRCNDKGLCQVYTEYITAWGSERCACLLVMVNVWFQVEEVHLMPCHKIK